MHDRSCVMERKMSCVSLVCAVFSAKGPQAVLWWVARCHPLHGGRTGQQVAPQMVRIDLLLHNLSCFIYRK